MSTQTKKIGPFTISGSGPSSQANVESFSLKLKGADFKIDHKARRKNKSPERRAIVHDFNDGLTFNWAKDYPGGVTINGIVKCPDTLIVKNKDVLRLISDLQKKILGLEKLYEMIDWNASQ